MKPSRRSLPDSGAPGRETGAGEPYTAIPEEFLARLERILPPADLKSAVRSFSEPGRTSFRLNTLITGAGEAIADLEADGLRPEPVVDVPGAYSVEARQRARLLAGEVYRSRRVYVQNPSSMLPALILQPEPGDEVLDLTAAPGSKSHLMACLMENTGRITAVEAVRSRYYKLRDNMRALGSDAVRPFFQDGTVTWRHRPEFFDRVLLDAPCSSEGRFRTDNPETMRYWSLKKVRDMSRKQRRLLFSAIQCLKPGGRLVYSTCSFSPEENEAVINRFLGKFQGALRVVEPGLDVAAFRSGLTEWDGREFAPALTHARRVVPDATMDGFFICCLEKTASTTT